MKMITINLKALSGAMVEKAVELGLTTPAEINNILASGVLTLEVEAGKIPADMMNKLVALEAIIEETPKKKEAPKKKESPKKESPKKESPEKETPATEESPKVEEAPKVEETPKKEAPKKKEVKKPLTEGEKKLEIAKNFGLSVALESFLFLEEKATKVTHAVVSGVDNVAKGGAIQNASGTAMVCSGIAGIIFDVAESSLGVNLDTLQSVNDVFFQGSSTVFGLSVLGNFGQGALKGSEDRTKEIIEERTLSREAGQKKIDSSIVLSALDLKF